jgi:membrane-associated phospholipid phosphatase
VTRWNDLILDAIRSEATPPPLAARNLALSHAAMFSAVNCIEGRWQSYRFAIAPPAGASPEPAAAAAAHEILVSLYPSRRAMFDRELAALPAVDSRQSNLDADTRYGRSVAQAHLAWRKSDFSSGTVPYVARTNAGQWHRTAPHFRPPELPHWPLVAPFAVSNAARFRPPGPPALHTQRYAEEFEQVKRLGGLHSTARTPEQTLIARFWSDFSYTVTPAGHWNQIAQDVSRRHGFTLAQNARLFALLNFALADASLVAWDAKYAFNSWRPITAIQEADRDGNPGTEADPDWQPLLVTPPFPEYISGHSVFSGAAARVLAGVLGRDAVIFSATSDTLPGVVRTYHSLWEAAEEIGMSRIYGGIHFLSADLDGLAAGRAVADNVLQHCFRPVTGPSGEPTLGDSKVAFLGTRAGGAPQDLKRQRTTEETK